MSLARSDRPGTELEAWLQGARDVTRREHAVRRATLAILTVAMVGPAVLHCAGGLLPSPDATQVMPYETWVWPGALEVDQLVHAYGTGVVTWCVWQALDGGRWGRPTARRRAAAFTLGQAAGLANELVEWLLDLGLPTLVGDLGNAAWDVVFNTAGATVALLLVHDLVGAQDAADRTAR